MDDTNPSEATSITAYPEGPLVVRGRVTIRNEDGTVLDTGRITALCRCGRSALKPLCDGAHKRHTGKRQCSDQLEAASESAAVTQRAV